MKDTDTKDPKGVLTRKEKEELVLDLYSTRIRQLGK